MGDTNYLYLGFGTFFYAFLMIHTLQNSKKKANEILDSTNTNIKIQNEGSKKY